MANIDNELNDVVLELEKIKEEAGLSADAIKQINNLEIKLSLSTGKDLKDTIEFVKNNLDNLRTEVNLNIKTNELYEFGEKVKEIIDNVTDPNVKKQLNNIIIGLSNINTLQDLNSELARLQLELKNTGIDAGNLFENIDVTNIDSIRDSVNNLNRDTTELVEKIQQYRDNLEELSIKSEVDFGFDKNGQYKTIDLLEKEKEAVDELLESANKLNYTQLETKFDELKQSQTYKVQEIGLRDDFEEAAQYTDQLKKSIGELLHLILPKESLSDSQKNIFNFINSGLINEQLYGLNVADKDSLTEDQINRLKKQNELIEYRNKLYYIDKSIEMDEAHLDVLHATIDALQKYLDLQKETSSTSSINKVAPKRIINDDGTVNSLYEKYIRVNNNATPNNTTVKRLQNKNGEWNTYELYNLPDKKEVTLFEHTIFERLNGFVDDIGDHAGIIKINEELEDVVISLIEALGSSASLSSISTGLGTSFNEIMRNLIADKLDKSVDELTLTDINNPENRKAALNDIIEYINNKTDVQLPYADADAKRYKKKIGDKIDKSVDFAFGDIEDSLDDINLKSTESDVVQESVNKLVDGTEKYITDFAERTLEEASRFDTNSNLATQVSFKTLRSEKNRSNKGLVDNVRIAQKLDDAFYNKVDKLNELTDEFVKSAETGDLDTLAGKINGEDYGLPPLIQQITSLFRELTDSYQNVIESDFRESLASIEETDLRINSDIFNNIITTARDKIVNAIGSEAFINLRSDDANSDIIKQITETNKANEDESKLRAINSSIAEYNKQLLNRYNLENNIKQLEAVNESGFVSSKTIEENEKEIERLQLLLEGVDNELESIRSQTINSELDIDFDKEEQKVESVQEIYQRYIDAFGGYRNAEVELNKALASLPSLNLSNVNSYIQLNENLREAGINAEDLLEDLKTIKDSGLIGMLNYSQVERRYQQTNTKGLKGDELLKTQQNNKVNEAILDSITKIPSNYSSAMVYDYDSIDTMNEFMGKIGEDLKDFDNSINELENSEFGKGNPLKIAQLKRSVSLLKTQFDNISIGLSEGSDYGTVKLAFDAAKSLSNDLIVLDARVKEAQKNVQEQQNKELQQQAQEISAAKFKHVMSYVSDQESLTGQKMPLQDQLEYYKSALPQFEEGSEEYIKILTRQRNVEAAIVKEIADNEKNRSDAEIAEIERRIKAQEQQDKELQQQAQQQEQAYNKVLSTVKRFADGVNNALKRVLSIVRKVISGIVNTVKAGFRIFNGFTNTIKRIIQLFGNFGNRVKGVQHDGNILKGTFTELKSKIDLLVGAYNKLFNNQFLENGKKLLQSIQTMNITLGGELTDNTIRWSKELERAFGVSAKGLVSQLQGINAELYGMGMDSGSTEVAGRNLAAVAQTLSGITGYDYETVISKIESGMKGMTQAIDDLGLSVRESQMNAFLKDLRARGGEFSNVATSFEKLNEQQRIYVRYAALMTQFRSRFNAEDYVKSLDSITGRLSILQARIESLKTTIGNFALQLLDKITIPLATFITFIENKIIALAKVFGIDLNLSSTLNKSSQSASNAAKDLGDVDDELNNIEKSADKAKGSLDSFDHISNISSSNGNNDSGSDFDYSKLLTVAPDYAQELEDIAKLQDDWLDEQWKKIQAWLKEKLQEIKDAISAWWLDLTGRIINWDVIANNLKQTWENIKETFSNIIGIAKELFNIIAGLVGMILDDLDFTELLVDITGLLASITGFVKEFLNTVREPLFDFYNNYLRKYVIEFGDFLHRKINEWIGYFDGLTSWAKSSQGKKDIDNWFDNLGKKIEDIVKKIRGVGYIISTVFLGKGKTFAPKYAGVNNDKLVKSSSDKYEEYGESGLSGGYLDAADSLNGIFTEILSIVGDIGKDIGEWWNTPDTGGLATLKKDLDRIDTILSENHEGFVQVIESIASSINKIKEATLNKILDILEWISKNPELVTGILSQISDILVMLIDHIGVIVALIGVSKLVSWGAQLAIILGQLKLFAGIDIVGGILGKITGMSTKISTIIGQLSAEPLVASIASTVSTVLATIGVVAGAILGIVDGILLLKEGIKLIVDNFSTAAFEIKNFWSAITGEQVLSNQQVEDNADTLLNNLKAKYGEKIPLSGLNEALTEYNNNLVAAGELSQEKIDEYVGYTEQMIIKTGDVYDDTSTAMSDTTKTLDEQIAESKVTINDYESNYKKANSNIRQSNATTKRSMSGTLSTLTSLLNTVRNLKDLAINPIKFVVNTVGSMAINAGVKKVKSFFGHANGGVPNKGSIFMANENGMPELVGNFGGYAGVANQQMIIEAMKQAIGSSVYEAVSQAMNNTDNGNNTPAKIEICKQGMFVGDDNAVRKLARTLQNSLVSSKGNISNIDFSTV